MGIEKLKELKMQKVVKVLLDYEEEVKDVISFEEMMKQFLKDDEYLKFLEILERTSKVYNFKVHSLCLMTHHYHLLLETKS